MRLNPTFEEAVRNRILSSSEDHGNDFILRSRQLLETATGQVNNPRDDVTVCNIVFLTLDAAGASRHGRNATALKPNAVGAGVVLVAALDSVSVFSLPLPKSHAPNPASSSSNPPMPTNRGVRDFAWAASGTFVRAGFFSKMLDSIQDVLLARAIRNLPWSRVLFFNEDSCHTSCSIILRS